MVLFAHAQKVPRTFKRFVCIGSNDANRRDFIINHANLVCPLAAFLCFFHLLHFVSTMATINVDDNVQGRAMLPWTICYVKAVAVECAHTQASIDRSYVEHNGIFLFPSPKLPFSPFDYYLALFVHAHGRSNLKTQRVKSPHRDGVISIPAQQHAPHSTVIAYDLFCTYTCFYLCYTARSCCAPRATTTNSAF